MAKYIMALDQGTTSSRAIIFNHSGTIVSTDSKEFKQIYPKPGWVEHDPMEIWSSQIEVAKDVLDKAGLESKDIVAVGITNQRETTIVWNKKTGKPVYNAIVWQCRRTAPICDQLKKKGLAEIIQKKTGLVVDAYFSGTKIKWILDNVDGIREKAKTGEVLFGTVDSWLIWNLTKGKAHVMDYSNASRTMLFNIHNLNWDEEILAELNIPREMLPKVLPSSYIYGHTDIEGYDLQKNTYSDQKFAKDTIKKLEDTTLIIDGAYFSEDINNKAKARGIRMIPTNLIGGTKNNNCDKFEIDEKEHLVKKCPSGHKPITSKFKEGSYRADFDKKHCKYCPFRKDCSVIEQKKSYLFRVSEKTLHRSRLITRMGTSEYQKLARKRAGVKAIPSILRRRYKIDHLPVRGLVRVKVYLGFKISAINYKRLIKGLMNRPKESLPTLLYHHLFSLFSFQRTYRVKFAA